MIMIIMIAMVLFFAWRERRNARDVERNEIWTLLLLLPMLHSVADDVLVRIR